ncbi:MAG: hypothetical protein AAF518_11785 [Spirochaetota bacterium]
MLRVVKISFLCLLTLTVFPIQAQEFQFGLKGVFARLYPNDIDRRKSDDSLNFYKSEPVEPRFSGGTGFFFRYLNASGRFSLYGDFSRVPTNQVSYERTDLLFLASLGGGTGSTSLNELLIGAATSKVKVDVKRQDFFTDAIFYFIPKKFGVGAGYRDIFYETSSNDTTVRVENIVDKRSYRTRGGQASLYANLPLDGIVMGLRASYFSLSGAFQQNQSTFTYLVDFANDNFIFYPFYRNKFVSGSPKAKRAGFELDFNIQITPDPDIKALQFVTGVTYQESRVHVANYSDRTFELTSFPGYNYTANFLVNQLSTQLFEAPRYGQKAIDKVWTIHFGVAYSFMTE